MITYYHPKDLDAIFDMHRDNFVDCHLSKYRHIEYLSIKGRMNHHGLVIADYVRRKAVLINSQPTIKRQNVVFDRLHIPRLKMMKIGASKQVSKPVFL